MCRFNGLRVEVNGSLKTVRQMLAAWKPLEVVSRDIRRDVLVLERSREWPMVQDRDSWGRKCFAVTCESWLSLCLAFDARLQTWMLSCGGASFCEFCFFEVHPGENSEQMFLKGA